MLTPRRPVSGDYNVHPACPACLQAALGALHFVLCSATKYNVEDGVLNTELQQLGLPKENADAVARGYRDNRDPLRDAALRDVLKVSCTSCESPIAYCSLAWRWRRAIHELAGFRRLFLTPCPCLPLPLPQMCSQLPSIVPGSVSWRVDRVIASSLQHDIEASTVQLSLASSTPGLPAASRLTFDIAKDKFDVLHAELRRAAALMATVSST